MLATTLGETLLQCAEPTDQPSACLLELEENAPSTCLPGLEENAREAPLVTSPPMPTREANEVVEAEDVMVQAPPGWTQVHPSRPVVPVGLSPTA